MSRAVPTRLALLLAGALLGLASASHAQPAPEAHAEATLEVWNRPIVVLRKTIGSRPPAARAAYMEERIDALPLEELKGAVTSGRFATAGEEGIEIAVGGVPVVRVYPGDVDPEGDETLAEVAEGAAERLREALAARVLQGDPTRLVRAVLLALGATAFFALMLAVIVRSRRFLTVHLFAASERQLRRVTRLGVDLRRYALLAAKYGVDALAWGLVALLAYLWLTFVFVQFPYSAPWGNRLGNYLFDVGRMIASSLVEGIPGFFTVLVILLVTRIVTRLVGQLFRSVQYGRVRGPWLDAETAEATRRIVVGVVWLFAVAAAFPFIPGSDSEVFRGIGVLAGLMLSLGSASIVSQAMSGLVVVYSRAFREGDYVKIGDVEGTVIRRGALSTKIRNVRNEEITVPNGVVVSSPTVNFTRFAPGGGALVSATVTIGYDAPWRQVHGLLELAAQRTEGVRREPAPYVVQRALSDFYVEYQLVAQIEHSADRPLVQSRLHAAIQDVFNEHGVQIMSPHFRWQPESPVVVPPEHWYTPPAEAPARDAREPRKTG